jgi:glutamyl-tRNA reductase
MNMLDNHMRKAKNRIKKGDNPFEVLDEFSNKVTNYLLHPYIMKVKEGNVEYNDKLKQVLNNIDIDLK